MRVEFTDFCNRASLFLKATLPLCLSTIVDNSIIRVAEGRHLSKPLRTVDWSLVDCKPLMSRILDAAFRLAISGIGQISRIR
jgi:hypothetical protein